MFRRPGRLGVITIPLVALFLLSGCSGAGSPGPSGSGGDGAGSDAPRSPLEPYFSALYPARDDAAQKKENAAVQDAVAACMKEQGFEYEPDPGTGTFFSSDSLDVEWGSEEFAKTYGYGISTDMFGAASGEDTEYVDPNQDYIDALSDGEQAAYSEALWGPPQVVGGDAGEVAAEPLDYDWKTAGCMGAAQHEIIDASDPSSDPEYASLVEGMNAIYQRVEESPAVIAKEKEWSGCLAEAGFPGFEHKADPSEEFSERLGELTMPVDEAGQPTAGSGDEPDPAALDALRADEIATATADFGCAEKTGYTSTLTTEQNRLEQEFVDENRERLDALVAHLDAE